MPPRLEPLREALRALPDPALPALRDAAMQASHLAPSFTAWIKHVSDWELDRRAGLHYFLLFPEELASPEEFVRGACRVLAEIGDALGGAHEPCTLASLLDALRCLVQSFGRYK